MTAPLTARLARWGLLALPLLVAVLVVALRWPDTATKPVDLTSNAPTFASVEELVAASDLVVVGVVEQSSAGRIISDPTNPAAGIGTTLYTIVVEETLAGAEHEAITVEHETSLLDGTPITVDGVEAPQLGERSVFYLVAGTTDDFPHYAIVGAQGRHS